MEPAHAGHLHHPALARRPGRSGERVPLMTEQLAEKQLSRQCDAVHCLEPRDCSGG